MNRWAERYQAGQHVEVWTEIVGLGEDLRADAEDLEQAEVVARATMRRARANVERLAAELPAIGYELEGEPFTPAGPGAPGELDELEAEVGRLPLALRIWFEEVGQVNLNGRHPAWELEYPDPLVVEAPVDYVLAEHREWREGRNGSRFEVPIAPDHLHKANVSGGMPYSMAVPDEGGDGLLLWERHQTTFVNYLRIAFAAAAMPGFTLAQVELPDDLAAIAGRLEAL